MKKIILSSILAPFLFANIPSQDINATKAKDDNETLEMMKIKQIKSENIGINQDLNHLFENSKFPVNDYIYKAGLKKPTQQEAIKETIKIAEEVKDEKPKEIIEEKPIIEEPKTNLNELKARLELNQLKMQQNSENQEKAKYKKMIRDELLANRTSGINDFANEKKYGVDGFSNQPSIDIATNEHKLSRMIRAGRLIPALLTTAISSDLNGIVTAQIEQDIYAAHGRAVLIPRGSKAIGFYTNNNQVGQDRLEIKWREIITPQGINILLTNAIVADNMGMGGAQGVLNNKYWERYALPFGISTISNALLLTIASKINKNSNGNNNNTTTTYQEQIYSNAQNDITQIVSDIIATNKAIQPTIEIKSGSRIFLVPTNHIWFSQPKNGEVLMKYFVE